MDMRITPLMIKIMLESNPLKYIMLVQRLAVASYVEDVPTDDGWVICLRDANLYCVTQPALPNTRSESCEETWSVRFNIVLLGLRPISILRFIDFRGFDPSRILIARGGTPRPMGKFPRRFESSNLSRDKLL